MQGQWGQSFPAGRSQEQGGTLVRDGTGNLQLVNTGGGTTGTFSPNRNVPAGNQTVRVFHTHPYDASEGGHTNVSLSGGDAGHMINHGDQVIVAQSGNGQYMFMRTDQTPANVDQAALDRQNNARIGQLMGTGQSFDQASRSAARETAQQNNLAYYEGQNGTLQRVQP
jgi:type VI secretion system secreted protein VgrG